MSYQTCECGNWVATNFKLVEPVVCVRCGEDMVEKTDEQFDIDRNKKALERYWSNYGS